MDNEGFQGLDNFPVIGVTKHSSLINPWKNKRYGL
jgi:hypothetical protein